MYKHLSLDSTRPTSFHGLMDELARSRSYFQHITLNIDCLESKLPDLEAKTVRIQGQVNQARCQLCSRVVDFDPTSYQGTFSPACDTCKEGCQVLRTVNSRNTLSFPRLKPDVLRNGQRHPEHTLLIEAVELSLRRLPKLVLIVGTSLDMVGAQSVAKEFCNAARSVNGESFWINKEAPGRGIEDLCDHVAIGDCDQVLSLDDLRTI